MVLFDGVVFTLLFISYWTLPVFDKETYAVANPGYAKFKGNGEGDYQDVLVEIVSYMWHFYIHTCSFCCKL